MDLWDNHAVIISWVIYTRIVFVGEVFVAHKVKIKIKCINKIMIL